VYREMRKERGFQVHLFSTTRKAGRLKIKNDLRKSLNLKHERK